MHAKIGSFVHTALPQRVVFGRGTRAGLPGEIDRLGARRALVLATPAQADLAAEIAALCAGRVAGVFAGAQMHTPVAVTEEAVARCAELGADCLLSVGGGSTTGLGKAIAARTGLDQIVVPTTYAGSEATSILGETEDGLKTTRRGPEILPEVIVYDVELTLGLPPALSATSGLNAIAHAAEALYAREGSPILHLLAEQSISALGAALPRILADPADMAARSGALYGAWLAGTCLGTAEMAIHHKLCHTLGGSFGLPHAETHAVLLAHSLAYVAPGAPDAMAVIARALGRADGDAPAAVHELARALGVPASLGALGLAPENVERAADIALRNPYWNPVPLTREGLIDTLTRARQGRAPGS